MLKCIFSEINVREAYTQTPLIFSRVDIFVAFHYDPGTVSFDGAPDHKILWEFDRWADGLRCQPVSDVPPHKNSPVRVQFDFALIRKHHVLSFCHRP